MFCLPAKYPFKTDEMDTNGKVREKASNIGDARGSLSKLIAIKSLVSKISRISRYINTNIKYIINKNIIFI